MYVIFDARNLKYLIAVLLLGIISFLAVDIYTNHRVDAQATGSHNQNSYVIFVEVDDNILYLLQDGKCIKKYPVATGKGGMPSPIGYWKIINKGKWGEGFGGYWMGINVPWGIYGIHGTNQPHSIGSDASHGCIRMHPSHARELYNIVPVGTPVTIVNGTFGPFGTGFRDIKPGDTGADVMEVQRRLKELNYYKGPVNGIYDESLRYSVHKFQKNNKLTIKDIITRKDLNCMGLIEFE